MRDYANMSEAECVALLVRGDEQVFEFIYRKHVRKLHRYAQSRLHAEEDAKEMVQAAFVNLWERRESLGTVASLNGYLHGIVRNMLAEHYRHNLVRNRYAEDFAFFSAKEHNNTEELQNLNETQALIQAGISALPNRMQMAFRLSREENLSIDHIADRMNITPRTAETLLSKALKRLRKNLGGTLALLAWLNSL